MSDEMLLTEIEDILDRIGFNFALSHRLKVAEEILATAKQHYEQTGIHIIKGTEHPEEFGHREQKRLDRPELREKIRRLIRKECFVNNGKCIPIGANPKCQICNQDIRELLALLIPDIEAVKKQAADTIKGIEEMYEEDEVRVIEEAKREERFDFKVFMMEQIVEVKDKKGRGTWKTNLWDAYGLDEKFKEWQALKEEKEETHDRKDSSRD